MVDPAFAEAIPLWNYMEGFEELSMEREFGDIYVRESDVLAAIPILTVDAVKYRYEQIAALPDTQRRAYNEPGNTSYGTTEMQEEGIFLQDEYFQYDRALKDHYGDRGRAKQERLKMIALARNMTRDILKSDHLANPRDPDGMQQRSAYAEQTVVVNNAASGGGALSLSKIDELLNEVSGATHLIMNRTWKPRLSAAARSNSLTNNFINMDLKDPFGRSVMAYGDIPILFGYPKSKDDDIIPFSEVASGGGSAVTTSIYAVRFSGEDGFFVIEKTPLSIEDEGMVPGVPKYSTHLKWDWGLVSKPWSIGRLSSISDAAIVA